MGSSAAGSFTLTTLEGGQSARLPALRLTLTPPAGAPVSAPLGVRSVVVGTSPECDLTVADPRMSRRHCEIRLTERGVSLRDLGSKNGTFVGDVQLFEALLPPGVAVRVGGATFVLTPEDGATVLALSKRDTFGEAVGASTPMRALFALLERAAPSDETIPLLGESGTGKEVLARAVHEHSLRRKGPFVVVDCGALAPSLVEAELFGHTRGAATGLHADRAGLLEEANGGTLFIDELGELPLDLQPKLLRAIENRHVRRLGSNEPRPFDARIVAATHRNLRAKTKDGSFRADLYFRLSVVEVHVPALRERKEDIPLLVERFLAARRPPSPSPICRGTRSPSSPPTTGPGTCASCETPCLDCSSSRRCCPTSSARRPPPRRRPRRPPRRPRPRGWSSATAGFRRSSICRCRRRARW